MVNNLSSIIRNSYVRGYLPSGYFFRAGLVLTEKQELVDRRGNYLYYASGVFGQDRTNYSLRLLDLNVNYYKTDKLQEISGQLQINKQGQVRNEKLKVNYPVYYGNRKIRFQTYGFSPKIILLDKEGNVKWQSYVALDFTSGNELRQTLFAIPNTNLALKIKFHPGYVNKGQQDNIKSLYLKDFKFDISILKKS